MTATSEQFLKLLRSNPGNESDIWGRASGIPVQGNISEELVDTASSALDVFSRHNLDASQGAVITGVVATIQKRVLEESEADKANALVKRLTQYVHTKNDAMVAFIVLRQFEPYLAQFTIVVADEVIELMTKKDVPETGRLISIRGLAFCVMFDLDPEYRNWPELSDARDECIAGCDGLDRGYNNYAAVVTKIISGMSRRDDSGAR